MTVQLLDGKLLASRLKENLKNDIGALKKKTGQSPLMVNIMVGEDPAAVSYANSQKKIAEDIGIQYKLVHLPLSSSLKEVIGHIAKLNQDKNVHGIMIYKPLPKGIDYYTVANSVAITKDLEGTNDANMGKMFLDKTSIIPCTAAAAMEHIKSVSLNLRGLEAVIVGRSEIVGKPLSLLLLKESATVTICHSGTSDAGKLKEHIGRADILVAAMGRPEFIKGEWVKEGAIVIDVGINKVNGKTLGDVEFESAKEKASYITPVPGGVGPVTVMMLMKNCLEAFRIQTGIL